MYTVDLHKFMPNAVDRVKNVELPDAKRRGEKLIKLVHGYGSSSNDMRTTLRNNYERFRLQQRKPRYNCCLGKEIGKEYLNFRLVSFCETATP